MSGRNELYKRLTDEELQEYECLYEIDAWGEERQDLRFAKLMSLTDACHRTSGTPLPPCEYMTWYYKELHPQPEIVVDQEALKEQVQTAFAALDSLGVNNG